MNGKVFTVGHGLLELDELVDLLRHQSVDLVIDVRSQPFSGRAPHFNTAPLSRSLEARGVSYQWVPALGGRPSLHLMTAAGAPDYERMAQEPETTEALDELAVTASRRTVVILCSESRPEECHRSRMLEPELARRGVWVEHILHSGEVAATPTLFA